MSRPELALVRGREPEPHVATHSSKGAVSESTPSDSEAGRALTMLALASSQRLEHPELEAVRMALLENVLITGREALASLQAWLSQCLSEYRGSRTSWDLMDTTGQLRMALARFHATALDSAQLLRTILPGLGDDVVGERPERPARQMNRLRGESE
jgi:hypothetical protein